MSGGFVTLHRKLQDNPIFQDSELLHLFICLLLDASHKDSRMIQNGEEIIIKRGQVKTGQYLLAMKTGIPRGNIWRKLDSLKKLGIVSIKPSSKYSIITIVKYDEYQTRSRKVSSKVSNKRVTSELQVSTFNNDNNDNNNTPAKPGDVGKQENPINQVIGVFYKTINPTINYGNKSTRKAAKELIDRFGLPEVIEMCNYAAQIQGQPYAPVITTSCHSRNNLPRNF